MAQRVVLDANVWVSAAAFPGRIPIQIIALARAKTILSVTSPAIIGQVVHGLARLGAALDVIDATDQDMNQLSEIVRPTITLSVITAKESDNRILECAVTGRVDAIVTGDRKHLLPLGQYEGIPIISPRDFIEAVDPR